MPRGDGTGPIGLGAKTERAAGYCAGHPVPGFMNPMPGPRGSIRGRGCHRFWRIGIIHSPYLYPYFTQYQVEPEDEIKYLQNMAETLKKELDTVEKRIDELSQKG